MDNRQKNRTEDAIIHMIREYQCVPRPIIYQMFCSDKSNSVNNKTKKVIEQCLRRLTRNNIIDYKLKEDSYCSPAFNGKQSAHLVKALWILAQFHDIQENYSGTNGVLIIFTRANDNHLYEIIHLAPDSYRVTVSAINSDTDGACRPKRIVLVDNGDAADLISDNILKGTSKNLL